MANKSKVGPAQSSSRNAGDPPLDDLELKEVVSKIRSSFNDLVIYNDQGQPTIDINKLVYKPNKINDEKETEKLRWYIPDYVLCTINFLSLTYATYYFLNGLTIISWRNSMQSFVVGNCTANEKHNASKNVCDIIQKQYGSNSIDWNPFTILRFYGPKDVGIHGLCLLICGLANLLNIVLAIHACLNGNRTLLVLHLVLDCLLFLFEVCLVTLLKITGRCDHRDREVMKAFLERYLYHYGKETEEDDGLYFKNMIKNDMIEFDLLQISLTCCGVGNWSDYLPRSVWTSDGEIEDSASIERYNLDKTEMIIPSTCCRQWWVRNIYCAHSVHLWTYPTATDYETHRFRQRISQWGCLPKLVGLCENMKIMAGTGGIVAFCIHFLLSIGRHIAAIFIIQTIDTLVLERKRIFRHKEKDFGDQVADTGIGEEGSIFPSLSTLFNDFSESEWGKRPSLPNPPTEKDIAEMQSRKDFNRMKDAMKSTHLEKWIATGRAFVEENSEPPAAKMSSSEGTAEKLLRERRVAKRKA